jgi:hypothetical protein
MKATIEYQLPEEEHDMKYALAGVDALLVLDDIDNEIRSYLKHDCGELKEVEGEDGKMKLACYATLEKIRAWIWERRKERNLPDLI